MEKTNNFINTKTENETLTTMELLDEIALTISKHFTGFKALKGGYLLTKLLEHPRATTDIDFSIEKKEEYEQLKNLFQDIGEDLKKRNIVCKYNIKEEIKEKNSGGVKFYDASGKVIAGIDVGLHDLSYGIREYKLTDLESKGFSVERMLSDKITSILSRKRFRRSKDLYDFFCLANTFNIDYELLYLCLESREPGDLKWENIPFNSDILREYKHAYEKFEANPTASNKPVRKKQEFEEVISLFYEFVNPLKRNIKCIKWDFKSLHWR